MKVTLILDDSDEYSDVEDSSEMTVQVNKHGPEITTLILTGNMLTWKKLLDKVKHVTEIHYGYTFDEKDLM